MQKKLEAMKLWDKNNWCRPMGLVRDKRGGISLGSREKYFLAEGDSWALRGILENQRMVVWVSASCRLYYYVPVRGVVWRLALTSGGRLTRRRGAEEPKIDWAHKRNMNQTKKKERK